MTKFKNINFAIYLFLLLITLPLLWNLFRPGFYTSHDGEWMTIRLTAFHDELRQGQLPVRWLSRLNHGYGYTVTNFLYPLPFYLAEPFYFVTKNPASAIQIVMGLSIMAMTIGIYKWLTELNKSGRWGRLGWCGNLSALVGAVVYVYSPYVAYNLYQRGSLGEIVAMGIVPWIFWAIATKKLYLTAILTAALITAHNVVAVIFLPIICLAGIKGKRGKKGIKEMGKIMLLSLGLSAFFWAPALAEFRYVHASQLSVSDFQNEYLSLSSAIERSGAITTIFTGGLPLFFLTKISISFWELFKPLQIIQFPWRLLSLFSFLGATTATFFLKYLAERLKRKSLIVLIVGFFIVGISFFSTKKFLTPTSFINRPPEYYQTNDDSTTVRAEYIPIWVKDLPTRAPDFPQIHYYPGLKIFADNKYILNQNPNLSRGLLVPNQQIFPSEKIRIVWSETWLRLGANLISAVTLLFLLQQIGKLSLKTSIRK